MSALSVHRKYCKMKIIYSCSTCWSFRFSWLFSLLLPFFSFCDWLYAVFNFYGNVMEQYFHWWCGGVKDDDWRWGLGLEVSEWNSFSIFASWIWRLFFIVFVNCWKGHLFIVDVYIVYIPRPKTLDYAKPNYSKDP